MLIYKYTSYYAGKLILENGSVRFSQVEVLNDPFECNPSFDEATKSFKEFIGNSPAMQGYCKNMTYVQREATLQKVVLPIIATFRKSIKNQLIFSLTKNEENLLMWSHYADSHHGMVIGFDYENPFFNQTDDSDVTRPYDVEYVDNRPEFIDFYQLLYGEISREDYRKFLLSKSTWWKYEREVRMFAERNAASEVKALKDGFDIFLFNFPKDSLKKIIFGSLMNTENKKALSEIAKTFYPHAVLVQALPSKNKFGLQFKSIKT